MDFKEFMGNQAPQAGQAPMGLNQAPQAGQAQDQQEDAELTELNNTLHKALQRLTGLIGKMHNKQKGYAVLHAVAQSMQQAMGINNTQLKNAVTGRF